MSFFLSTSKPPWRGTPSWSSLVFSLGHLKGAWEEWVCLGKGLMLPHLRLFINRKTCGMVEGDGVVAHLRASAQARGLACIFFKHLSHDNVFNFSLEILSKYLSYIIPNSIYFSVVTHWINRTQINCYCYPILQMRNKDINNLPIWNSYQMEEPGICSLTVCATIYTPVTNCTRADTMLAVSTELSWVYLAHRRCLLTFWLTEYM